MRSKSALPAIRVVLEDNMGLTKIDYNSCNFNDGLPVTVRFARMVGEGLGQGKARRNSPSNLRMIRAEHWIARRPAGHASLS